MRGASKLVVVVAIVAWVLIALNLASQQSFAQETGAKATDSALSKPDEPQRTGGRNAFKLPTFFDFSRYKSIFKKSYKSITEELIRQKLFIARAFRTFMAAIKYKLGKCSYYLKINKRSDWTPDELDANLLHNNREGLGGTSRPEPAPLATEEEVAAELHRFMENDVLAEFEMPAVRESHETQENQTPARDFKRVLSIDSLGPQPETVTESPEVRAKYKARIPSNNPDYERPEMMSLGAGEEMEHDYHELDYFVKIEKASARVAGRVGSLFKSLNDLVVGKQSPPAIQKPVKSDLPDEVFVDQRRSGCFFKAREQGRCGSCYAFAYIALLEYMYCKATGNLVEFSEQYMIDCGYRENERMEGCDGAPLFEAGEFIVNYGIELRSTYPYTKRRNDCPYPKNTPKSHMGYLKTKTKLFYITAKRSALERLVVKTPMVVGIGTKGSDFHEYGGGVHDMNGCPAADVDHGVLLIGHGREDGQEYWLMRNSHGTTFGEDGYYKLAKSANCIFYEAHSFGNRRRNFDMKPKLNSKSDQALIKKAGDKIGRLYIDKFMSKQSN